MSLGYMYIYFHLDCVRASVRLVLLASRAIVWAGLLWRRDLCWCSLLHLLCRSVGVGEDLCRIWLDDKE